MGNEASRWSRWPRAPWAVTWRRRDKDPRHGAGWQRSDSNIDNRYPNPNQTRLNELSDVVRDVVSRTSSTSTIVTHIGENAVQAANGYATDLSALRKQRLSVRALLVEARAKLAALVARER